MKKKILLVIISLVSLILIISCIYALTGKIKYEIVENTKLIASFDIENATEKSYNVVEKDNEYYLVICYGEQNKYYQTIEIENIKVTGKIIIVDVNLKEEENQIEMNSYPRTAIKLNKKPIYTKVNYK